MSERQRQGWRRQRGSSSLVAACGLSVQVALACIQDEAPHLHLAAGFCIAVWAHAEPCQGSQDCSGQPGTGLHGGSQALAHSSS